MHSRLNWSEKVGQLLFGGHKGRILRILVLFLCALGVLVGIYRARGARIRKEQVDGGGGGGGPGGGGSRHHQLSSQLLSSGGTKWVIVSIDSPQNSTEAAYACSLVTVAKESGWKIIVVIESGKVDCCRMPDCYGIHWSQFLRMSYKSASVLKKLLSTNSKSAYSPAVRNLAYIWVIHRGARFIFDAYLQEYVAMRTPLELFEKELSRQLQTFALDDSLALVEDNSGSRGKSGSGGSGGNLFRNPYGHFGRPDLSLLPNNKAEVVEFPNFRICEVRPPSLEKFLETDNGWWDEAAPALVLPGDTMPPLCTRNTLFSPDVFWALPLLPDYSTQQPGSDSTETIPPWYMRGLWAQSLLGDLGGSVRLSLNRIPTLPLVPSKSAEPIGAGPTPSSSKLLKRWHCRSRSTYRCLSLISKELSRWISLPKSDLNIIEAWIVDLKSIHYSEPPMLPRRRSHTNPCLGADGLHGVSFFPQIPRDVMISEDEQAERNKTLSRLLKHDKREISVDRDKRGISLDLLPPLLNSTYESTDWENFNTTPISYKISSLSEDDTYFPADYNKGSADKNRYQLLSTITENVCPGYSALISPGSSSSISDSPSISSGSSSISPGSSSISNSQTLLIIVFKNGHYDLLPTLEAMYRSSYTNILYCGHPHVSIDLFMKKYQTVEQRSLSFLPTYTKATYECLLGAMEMNYDVDGYLLITDDALIKSWRISGLDKRRIWLGESKTDVVDAGTWGDLDEKGMKLPKLIDGLINSFKLFSFILAGGNSHSVHKRSLQGEGALGAEGERVGQMGGDRVGQMGSQSDRVGQMGGQMGSQSDRVGQMGSQSDRVGQMGSQSDRVGQLGGDQLGEFGDRGQSQMGGEGLEQPAVAIGEGLGEASGAEGETLGDPLAADRPAPLTANETTSDWDIDVGGDEDLEEPAIATPTTTPIPSTTSESSRTPPALLDDQEMMDILLLTTPTPLLPLNSTESDSASSAGDLPLYHVEHGGTEQPTPPTWHKPSASDATTAKPGDAPPPSSASASAIPPTLSESLESIESKYEHVTTTIPSVVMTTELNPELKHEMELLLESLQDVFSNMVEIVRDYSNFSVPLTARTDGHYDPHRISPREFRHIRCSPHPPTEPDPHHHQDSALCTTLRDYILKLAGEANPTDGQPILHLAHTATPVYYIPSRLSKPFYSVANVLLHFNVLDELALPLLFQGLATQPIKLNRGGLTDSHTQFVHPFNHHKIYQDKDKQAKFCTQFMAYAL